MHIATLVNVSRVFKPLQTLLDRLQKKITHPTNNMAKFKIDKKFYIWQPELMLVMM